MRPDQSTYEYETTRSPPCSIVGTAADMTSHCACAESAALAGTADAPQSRRAWPPTHGSASQAAQADDHWSSGGHAPRPPGGHYGWPVNGVKWTSGQKVSWAVVDQTVVRKTRLRLCLVDTALRHSFSSGFQLRRLLQLEQIFNHQVFRNQKTLNSC